MNDLKRGLIDWLTKNKPTSTSTGLARPYTDAIISHLEDLNMRNALYDVISVDVTDLPAFSLSYDLLPCIIARFCARCQYAHQEEKYTFIADTLLKFISALYSDRSPVKIGSVIINPTEIDNLKKFLQSKTGVELNRSEFINTELRLDAIARFYLEQRGELLQVKFIKECKEHGDEDQALKKTVIFAAKIFVHGATTMPTEEDVAAASTHIYNIYLDIHKAIC